MKAAKIILACLTLAICLSAQAAVETPKHAFKHSLDQMLAELPNVQSQLSEAESDGLKRWSGTVQVGSAAAVVQISGKDSSTITGLTVVLLSTPSTNDADYERAETLRDVLFQGLLGRGSAFNLVNNFFVEELARQQPILLAGGKPKSTVKKIAKGTSEVRLELARAPQGLLATYAMKLL
ncbi:hypothetical protein [Pseudomonas poae]|uniref:hypothetical protein n=1 Tax=Pseudomonas poae TaxID=200451 RepID=UPI0030D4BA77